MNFIDLFKRLNAIEKLSESQIDECPCQDNPQPQPKQSDSVNMNINISGQGSNGIRDLLDIFRNIESGEESEIIVGEPSDIELDADDSADFEIIDDSYANAMQNASDPHVYDTDSITFTGDDLASKGTEALKKNGGGNPFQHVSENLINELKSLYTEIKNR